MRNLPARVLENHCAGVDGCSGTSNKARNQGKGSEHASANGSGMMRVQAAA